MDQSQKPVRVVKRVVRKKPKRQIILLDKPGGQQIDLSAIKAPIKKPTFQEKPSMKMIKPANILQQVVTPKVSKLVVAQLEPVYNEASNGVDPEKASLFAQLFEKQVHDQFKTMPPKYFYNIAKLKLFLDKDHPVGQFAKLFRIKALQDIYTPKRLVEMDITEMLPEVFLNPRSTPAAKLDLYQQIYAMINAEKRELTDVIASTLDPTAQRRPPVKLAIAEDVTKAQIKRNEVPVKKLCENPYWNIKEVNIIICRDEGKFYCLDIKRLLTELANTGVATNYYTGNELSKEVTDNLRNRYAREILEISKGNDPKVGERTSAELQDLVSIKEELQKFKMNLNETENKNKVLLYGIDEMDDGSDNGFSVIPQLTVRKFEEYLDEEPYAGLERINTWIDENVSYINGVLSENQPDNFFLDNENIIDDADADIDTDNFFLDKAQMQSSNRTPTPDDLKGYQQRIINERILVPDSISLIIFTDYINRLETIQQTILDDLQTTSSPIHRDELNSTLLDLNKQLKIVRNMSRTIRGIIELLQEALSQRVNDLDKYSADIGMQNIYPENVVASQTEINNLKESIGQIQNEIAYLEELDTNLANTPYHS